MISRRLARLRDALQRIRRERARNQRRRRRILDWEQAIQRRPWKRAKELQRAWIDGERSSCAFCDVTRGWLVGLCTRLVDAVRAVGRGIVGMLGRARRSLDVDESETRGAPDRRIFRRHSYPGSRNRRYDLHVPRAYSGDAEMPLLMVLHGCRQNSSDIRSISNFDAIAEREGFIVVYPFVTAYAGMRIRNCWGWWIDSEIRPGAGEVEDLWQIIEQVKQEVRVDERRIHIAGLSSGGGMAVAAMVAHADKIASGAVVAGVAYSESPRAVTNGAASGVEFKQTERVVGAMRAVLGEHGRPSPIFIVHSFDDPIVHIQAARNLRDSWAQCYGIDATRPASESAGVGGGAAFVHAKYRTLGRRSAIETLFIEERGHGWYGGNPGRFSYPAAPDTSELIWRFCKRHPLSSESRRARRAQIRKAG